MIAQRTGAQPWFLTWVQGGSLACTVGERKDDDLEWGQNWRTLTDTEVDDLEFRLDL